MSGDVSVELEFEWDQEKARVNLAKHRVSFFTAAEIFGNELVERVDDREDYCEIRFITLGRVETQVYRVVFTWRAENLVRIISAQKASREAIQMTEKFIIVRHTLSEIEATRERGEDETSPEAPGADSLGPAFWSTARVVMPQPKTSVHLRLDNDVVEWFEANGKGHLTRMNAVLRAYVDAHRDPASRA